MEKPTREARPVAINARISETGAEWIDLIAQQEQRTRSDVIRILLKEAIETRGREGRLPPRPDAAPKPSQKGKR